MTFTYNAGSPTRREMVRLLMGDTNSAAPRLQDEEIYLLAGIGASDPVGTKDAAAWYAAAACWDAVASKWASLADMAQGDQRLSASQMAEAAERRAAHLRAEAKRVGRIESGAKLYAGGLSYAEKEAVAADEDFVQPIFTREQADDPAPVGVGRSDWP